MRLEQLLAVRRWAENPCNAPERGVGHAPCISPAAQRLWNGVLPSGALPADSTDRGHGPQRPGSSVARPPKLINYAAQEPVTLERSGVSRSSESVLWIAAIDDLGRPKPKGPASGARTLVTLVLPAMATPGGCIACTQLHESVVVESSFGFA